MAEQLPIALITEVDNILNFQVRGNRVLVKPSDKDAPKTAGGILIDSKATKGMLSSGTIVSIGTAIQDLKEGDTVFFFRENNEPGSVRQGNDIYFWYADYNIIAVHKETNPLSVAPGGEITE